MKTTPALFLLSLLLGVRVLGIAPDEPLAQLQFTWVDPADPAVATIRQAGEKTIQLVGGRLISEVNQVLAAKGAEEAIDVLHLKTLSLPASAPGQPVIIAVKRTSLRIRNLVNAPDSADLAALMSIEKELMDGNNPPKVLVQHVAASGLIPAEWRVYRPIGVVSACLVCHGPADSLLPSVKAKLARLYPADHALNYATYDWRGVIRVSIVA
ncbi:MAG: DUF3365 domain-containing protein, partial [bacterium]|nr:DUF3365 domain-containing protein [bacterium]